MTTLMVLGNGKKMIFTSEKEELRTYGREAWAFLEMEVSVDGEGYSEA